MAGRFMIDGIWCDVPEGENLNDWLNEIWVCTKCGKVKRVKL